VQEINSIGFSVLYSKLVLRVYLNKL